MAFRQVLQSSKQLFSPATNFGQWYLAFGFAYLGSVQYYLYNIKFVQWCGGITAQVGHAGVAPLKTFMDQAIQ